MRLKAPDPRDGIVWIVVGFLIFALATLLLPQWAGAQTAAAEPRTALDWLQAVLQPVIADYLSWAILGIAAFFMRHLPAKWRLDVEQRHREALHRALDTGVGLAFDTLQKHPAVAAHDAAVTVIVDYVRRSVPDALKRLGPSQEHLEKMARAKLTARMDELLGRDRLAEALREAGA